MNFYLTILLISCVAGLSFYSIEWKNQLLCGFLKSEVHFYRSQINNHYQRVFDGESLKLMQRCLQ